MINKNVDLERGLVNLSMKVCQISVVIQVRSSFIDCEELPYQQPNCHKTKENFGLHTFTNVGLSFAALARSDVSSF